MLFWKRLSGITRELGAANDGGGIFGMAGCRRVGDSMEVGEGEARFGKTSPVRPPNIASSS